MTTIDTPMGRTHMRTLDDYVRVYDYDLKQELEHIKTLENWRKHSWYNPATRVMHSEAEKELDVRDLDDQPELFSKLTDVTVDAFKQYANELMLFAAINNCSKIRLNRYPTGSLMRVHSDHIHSIFDGETKGIPAVSAVGLLNDDFKGGEFLMCGKTYPLKAGQIIVWPSCFLYPHEVSEVTSGTRYSFVSWAW